MCMTSGPVIRSGGLMKRPPPLTDARKERMHGLDRGGTPAVLTLFLSMAPAAAEPT